MLYIRNRKHTYEGSAFPGLVVGNYMEQMFVHHIFPVNCEYLWWYATCNCPSIMVCVLKLQTYKCCSLQHVGKANGSENLADHSRPVYWKIVNLFSKVWPKFDRLVYSDRAVAGFVKFVFQTRTYGCDCTGYVLEESMGLALIFRSMLNLLP